MREQTNFVGRRGFALPTVLIASIVLLTILAVSVTATAAVRTTLKNQYYSQLAKAAGEAGVVYAKSCLAQNENEPQWSNAKPLTPATDCAGDLIGSPTCPGDTACSVTVSGNVRSSFSVPEPTLDSDGKAVTIANNGYVDITRTSDGSIWKTYTQPSVQAAVVPDLCSGQATGALGWTNAQVVTGSQSTPLFDGASPIGVNASNSVLPGPVYYQKSFSVTSAGNYTVTSSAGGTYDLFIDGKNIQAQKLTTKAITTTPLDVGCHTLTVKVENGGLFLNGADLRVSVKPEGTEVPIVTTDSSWRVTIGSTYTFSDYRYFQSSSWSPVRDMGAYTVMNPTGWVADAGDMGARSISTNHSFSGNNYPPSSYAYFLNTNSPTWNLSAPTEFKLVVACDDICGLYIDGNLVLNDAGNSLSVSTTTLTLGPGQHQIGLELNNTGSTDNPARFLFSAVRTSDGMVVDRSGPHWIATSSWYSNAQTLPSYDARFTPVPGVSNKATLNTLLVGGGGGGGRAADTTNRVGGGGGGGGVVDTTVSLAAGVYPVIVGDGGPGAIGASDFGDEVGQGNGSNTSFAFLTALGGGGGGPGRGNDEQEQTLNQILTEMVRPFNSFCRLREVVVYLFAYSSVLFCHIP